jgi:hypothetical protein
MMFQYNHNNASDLLLLIDIPPCLTASILLQPPSLRQVICIHSLSALPTHLPRLAWGSQSRLETLFALSIGPVLLNYQFGGAKSPLNYVQPVED